MNPMDLARPEIRALEAYASARALADSAGILLNANENPWPPPNDDGMALNRYPDPQPVELKNRLAERYEVSPDQLLITRGSDEGIDLLVRAFCRASVDSVLTCPPCFGMYALSARIQGARVIEVPLIEGENGWKLDEAGLLEAPPCRLYFLCTPNNPTGNRIQSDLIAGLANRVADHGLVVVDEAYVEFTDAPSASRLLDAHPNLVVLRTLSKAFGLAGCRIGSVLGHSDLIGLLKRIIAPYPLPTPSIRAALAALQATDDRVEQLITLRRQKARLVEVLSTHPAIRKLWPGEANFILIRVASATDLVAAAATAGIRLRNQSSQHGLDGCVRITIGTPEETSALIHFFKSWNP